jgi:hypothetical protein
LVFKDQNEDNKRIKVLNEEIEKLKSNNSDVKNNLEIIVRI